MSYGEPHASVNARIDWYLPWTNGMCVKMFPGFPDEGVSIFPETFTQLISDAEKLASALSRTPWESFDYVSVCAHSSHFLLRIYCPPEGKHAWYEQAMHTFINRAKYATRPSVMAKYRDYIIWSVPAHTVYWTFARAVAGMANFDIRSTFCREIEMQLLVWLTPYVDWHKQWVKDGCPINFPSDD